MSQEQEGVPGAWKVSQEHGRCPMCRETVSYVQGDGVLVQGGGVPGGGCTGRCRARVYTTRVPSPGYTALLDVSRPDTPPGYTANQKNSPVKDLPV